MAKIGQIVQVRCSNCGGNSRNHRVIHNLGVKWVDDRDAPHLIHGYTSYEIVKCLGCDTVRFRMSETSDDYAD